MTADTLPGKKVYILDTSPLEDEELYSSLYGRVSAYRREKADRLRFSKDRCLSLGAEYLLMCACADFGIDYEKTRVFEDGHKKPFFENEPVFFNLAHSERRAMCVMSDLKCGCDVEAVGNANLEIAKRFFSPGEYALLEKCESDDERRELFFRLWTLKESFMKCTGLGFALPLADFSVIPKSGRIRVEQTADSSDYSFYEYSPGDGYRYAWCLKDETEEGRNEYGSVEFKEILLR